MGLRRGKTTATSNADVTELPTRLARLTGYLAVILVRKSFTAATAAPTAVSAAATIAARAAVAGTAARTTRTAGFGFGTSFVDLQIAPAEIFAVESCNGFGCIRVDDSVWRVTGEDMNAGAKVRVTGVEQGALLRVAKA